ncbi:unnamed protein product [Brassica oleracea]|uniref:Uncharacterized protein n=2 Tax=Brassica oleracea TaxID=3712 RepID=A0A0D3BU88_BRAOL|nr:unnamed protein product [Brassica oleracea]
MFLSCSRRIRDGQTHGHDAGKENRSLMMFPVMSMAYSSAKSTASSPVHYMMTLRPDCSPQAPRLIKIATVTSFT